MLQEQSQSIVYTKVITSQNGRIVQKNSKVTTVAAKTIRKNKTQKHHGGGKGTRRQRKPMQKIFDIEVVERPDVSR